VGMNQAAPEHPEHRARTDCKCRQRQGHGPDTQSLRTANTWHVVPPRRRSTADVTALGAAPLVAGCIPVASEPEAVHCIVTGARRPAGSWPEWSDRTAPLLCSGAYPPPCAAVLTSGVAPPVAVPSTSQDLATAVTSGPVVAVVTWLRGTVALVVEMPPEPSVEATIVATALG
jgi:hypothetical protein